MKLSSHDRAYQRGSFDVVWRWRLRRRGIHVLEHFIRLIPRNSASFVRQLTQINMTGNITIKTLQFPNMVLSCSTHVENVRTI